MHKQKSIKFKAGILMVIFSLNMIVGFACSLGLRMSFNEHHHDGEVGEAVHIHADGKRHLHNAAMVPGAEEHKKGHHHNENAEKESGKSEKGCCSDSVVKISLADKAVPVASKITNPVFFTFTTFRYPDLTRPLPVNVAPSTWCFVRGHHPPIPDIRIAISSFLI